jgi:transposase InsO family protein
VEQRYDLVRQMKARQKTVEEICQQFGISRQTAYKWRARYRQKQVRGLEDKSRRPLRRAGPITVRWQRRVRRVRQKLPTWGSRKLRYELQQRFGGRGVPSTAAISRWLRAWGLARGRRRRLRGPVILRAALHVPRRCHEVWTVDFKGWYRTGDGTCVNPLTVRDLHSRYTLAISLLPNQTVEVTRREFQQLFKKHGVPARIRCDNGAPFGAGGPTKLTRLSAWWTKLGIEVQFIRPGHPGENGSHEHFHRVYKAEVARKPERTVRAQQRRSDRWLQKYNVRRPHESLRMRPPAEVFKVNRRRLRRVRPWSYPVQWESHWVKGSGEITRQGKRRYIGEAFARDYVGLKPTQSGTWEVFFGPVLVGVLHENESGSIRFAQYERGS